MWIVAASFVGIFLLIVGAYWLFVLRPEGTAERALARRLRPTRPKVPQQLSVAHGLIPRSTLPLLNRALNRFVSSAGPIESMIARADLSLTTGQFVLASIFAGACGMLATLLTVDVLWASVATAALCGSLPWMAVRALAARRIARFEEQFPEAIDLIARSLRAGHALTTGFDIVATEVPEPARSEFKLLYDRQNYGMPLPDALHQFANRVPLVDARFFATAVLTQREAGGNLAEVLDSLAATIRDRFRMKRQVRVLSAHGRITATVLAGLPFAVAGILWLAAPAYLMPLFTDPMGVRMLLAAAVLQVIGLVAIRRIVQIEI
jgi:tight adherence protein B